jgi:hypothetical protein
METKLKPTLDGLILIIGIELFFHISVTLLNMINVIAVKCGNQKAWPNGIYNIGA